MKLLLDACVWGRAKSQLETSGHDVVWAGDWASDPGDSEILARAHAEERVLITLDKDFGELAVFHGQPNYGIIRLVDIAATKQAEICDYVIEAFQKELLTHAILTVEPNRVRIRTIEKT